MRAVKIKICKETILGDKTLWFYTSARFKNDNLKKCPNDDKSLDDDKSHDDKSPADDKSLEGDNKSQDVPKSDVPKSQAG